MKFLHLVWAGIWRKPVRAILTLASIVMAFLLFGLLQGFVSGLGASVKLTHADVLLTFSRVSQVEPLPIAEAQQIRTVPGVASVTPAILFLGSYRTPLQIVPAFALDVDELAKSDPGLITPAQLAAMKNDRAGALLSPAMGRYGWKVGDKVPIRSALWTNRYGKNVWDLDILGTHGGSTDDMFRNLVLVNYDYVDQARTASQGTASLFVLKIADPNRAAAIAHAVDALFANSPHETKTASQRQIAQDQLKQISGLGVAVQAIVGAAFFALLFSVGSVMMQSVRERTPELAVLKTLGFTDTGILGLILSETVLLCMFAAAIGLGLAALLFPAIRVVTGFGVQGGPTLAIGFLMAAALALLTGLAPAIRGMRLSIVDALAGR